MIARLDLPKSLHYAAPLPPDTHPFGSAMQPAPKSVGSAQTGLHLPGACGRPTEQPIPDPADFSHSGYNDALTKTQPQPIQKDSIDCICPSSHQLHLPGWIPLYPTYPSITDSGSQPKDLDQASRRAHLTLLCEDSEGGSRGLVQERWLH